MSSSRQRCVAVVDGLGGGIGVQLVTKLREALGVEAKIMALGTNAIAAERMIKAGASCGACGENAIVHSVSAADIITGPIGIVIGNSMMGELTCAMAQAVLSAQGKRILLPIQNDHFSYAGIEVLPLSKMIEKTVALVTAGLQ
ncbi:MAG: DUF3842 family protein [Termitinemataceae bacterium]|nr:MAG: DUF3842 family protein [Termitinemataceae bacterium]